MSVPQSVYISSEDSNFSCLGKKILPCIHVCKAFGRQDGLSPNNYSYSTILLKFVTLMMKKKNLRYPTVVCLNGWSQSAAEGWVWIQPTFIPPRKAMAQTENSESGLTVTETQIWLVESNPRTVHVSELRIAQLFIFQTNVFWCSTQERRKNVSLAGCATFGTRIITQNYQFNIILDHSILSTAFWLNYAVCGVELEVSTVKRGCLEQIAGMIRGRAYLCLSSAKSISYISALL